MDRPKALALSLSLTGVIAAATAAIALNFGLISPTAPNAAPVAAVAPAAMPATPAARAATPTIRIDDDRDDDRDDDAGDEHESEHDSEPQGDESPASAQSYRDGDD